MPSSKPAKIGLAVILMLLFIAALGYRLSVTSKASGIVGPSQMAVGPDAIYISYNHQIIELSRSGAIRGRHPLSALGMTFPPIDMLMLGDGRLLLADQSPARLLACDPITWSCQTLAEAVAGKFNAQYKLIVDPADDSLMASDFDSGRLWRLSLENSRISTLTDTGLLSGTNDLAMDRNGDLWVADSKNYRIALLHGDDHDQWRISRSFDADNDYARRGHDWPMMLALDKAGDLWVTQPNPTALGSADLVIYDPDKGANSRVALPEDAHPTDLAVTDDGVLATDLERFDLYRIDPRTHAVSRLADPAFYAVLEEDSQRKRALASQARLAMIAMVIFGASMILAAVWATPKARRWSRPDIAAPLVASNAEIPRTNGIYWLKRNPKVERWLAWAAPMLWLGVLFPILVLGGLIFSVSADAGGSAPKMDLHKVEELKHMFVFMIVTLGGIPTLLRAGLRSIQVYLGTDGHRLYVKSPAHGQSSFSPERLVYNDSQILFRDRVFSIKTGKGRALYVAGEIDTYLAPLLRNARKLGPQAMLAYKFKHREPMLMGGLAYTLLVLITGWLTGAWLVLFPSLSVLIGSGPA